MTRSPNPGSRATREAASCSAAAVVAFAALWVLSTQVPSIRAISPFSDDPWDAFMTYAAIVLPFVVGPTWIRVLAHRERHLRPSTARRIRAGSAVAAVIVLTASAAALHAISVVGFPSDAGVAGTYLHRLALGSAVLAGAAILLIVRAGRQPAEPAAAGAFEPDTVDDVVAIAVRVGSSVGLGRQAGRAAATIEVALESSRLSPRRHRLVFGIAIALAAAGAFDVWHAIREGPWGNVTAPLVYAALVGVGVLAAWAGTVGPLRLLRPPGTDAG